MENSINLTAPEIRQGMYQLLRLAMLSDEFETLTKLERAELLDVAFFASITGQSAVIPAG